MLVNTCGFIRPAVEEAIDTILELAAFIRRMNPHQLLVVTGCMVQRYGKELVAELPEVDLFVGLDDFPRIGELIERIAPDQSGYHHTRSCHLSNGQFGTAKVIHPFFSLLSEDYRRL